MTPFDIEDRHMSGIKVDMPIIPISCSETQVSALFVQMPRDDLGAKEPPDSDKESTDRQRRLYKCQLA